MDNLKSKWILYITNHFTHPVVEAQGASPRYHLARKMIEEGWRLIVYCPLGRHEGSPIEDFLVNLKPRYRLEKGSIYLFPPLLMIPGNFGTAIALILGTVFIMTFLTLTRIRVAAQYSTTMLVSTVGAIIRTAMKIPLVANYGDPDFARERGLSRKAFKFCEDLVMARRKASTIVYVDEVVGEYVKDNFQFKNTFFLPNGGYEKGFVPIARESQPVKTLIERLGLANNRVVLYAGQLTSVYRLDLLISSAQAVIQQVRDVKFLIIGSGPTLVPLRQSVSSAGIRKYFLFLGSVPYNKISPYIVLSDVCVQLLDDWCMGTKVIMYMVHKKAVLAMGNWYDQYGSFLKNGDNILMVPVDSEKLAKALIRLLNDEEMSRRIGESGWIAVRPYTWEKHADETLRLLNEAIMAKLGK